MKYIGRNLFFGAAIAALATASHALPVFLTFASGAAGIVTSGPAMLITNATDTVIHWQSFDIADGETVSFQALSPGLSILNRVVDGSPVVIAGSLTANENIGFVVDGVRLTGTLTVPANPLCLSINAEACPTRSRPVPLDGVGGLQLSGEYATGTIQLRPGAGSLSLTGAGATLSTRGGDFGGSLSIRPGSNVTFTTQGLNLPLAGTIVLTSSSVTAVPEPESYAMLFAGLLTVLGLAQRKKRAENPA